jgi:hypothetical protein
VNPKQIPTVKFPTMKTQLYLTGRTSGLSTNYGIDKFIIELR